MYSHDVHPENGSLAITQSSNEYAGIDGFAIPVSSLVSLTPTAFVLSVDVQCTVVC